MSYIYEPLSDDELEAEIRVAVLLPSWSFRAELQVEFMIRPLWVDSSGTDSDTDPDANSEDGNNYAVETSHTSFTEEQNLEIKAPKTYYTKYEALSYVWGSTENPSHVRVISGRHPGIISITQNLDIALRHLRLRSKSRYLWIDALCINQEDNQEKSIQVANMSMVYMNAAMTTAWLGPCENDSDWAIQILQMMKADHSQPNRSLKDAWKDEGNDASLASEHPILFPFINKVGEKLASLTDRVLTKIFGEDETVRVSNWKGTAILAVYSLLSRPYFERAWIRQELTESELIFFQCGTKVIPEDVLWDAVDFLGGQSHDGEFLDFSLWEQTLEQISTIARLKAQRLTLDLGLLDLLHRNNSVKCHDPRDRIYSVLSMLDIRDRSLFIKPDYSQTVEQVFTDVARKMISHYRNLDILQSCELSTRVLQIPSWVPDWSSSFKCIDLQFHHVAWSACGFISAPNTETPNASSKSCPVSGIEIGRVSRVVEHQIAFQGRMQNVRTDLAKAEEQAIRFLHEIGPQCQVLPSEYGPTKENIYEAYTHLIAQDRCRSDEKPFDLNDDFTDILMYLVQIWSSSDINTFIADWKTEDDQLDKTVMKYILYFTHSKSFLETENGYIAFAPTGTKPGDVVVVLLGAITPVILRPVHVNSSTRKFLVVGPAYVHGLMHGEAIYGSAHASRYRFVCKVYNAIEGTDYCKGGYLDLVTETLENDPVRLLEQAGIKVESFTRVHHRLIVEEDTLRTAGIALEDFILI